MAKNLVQMSINGMLYDIRDQRMTTKLDFMFQSLNSALTHKQDITTAVVTNEASVNWIGRLTSGSTSSVTRYKDDYIETITGPADTHIHSLWFSMGPISYDPADKENKELEQQRAWSKSFGVEFQELTKRPRILGLDDKDQRAEVNIYGKSLHTEYIDSPLGINYIHPDKVEAIEHNIIGLPHSIPELDCLQWLYYGKRDNETNTTPLLENINIIGNASAITNIALWDFFQKEDNSYYRVLSEERIANKRVNKEQKSSNAYKIVTLDENGIIPDIFLGELKSNPLNIGNVQLADTNSQFIIRNDNTTEDNFVIAIQPSDTDTDTTKLTQTTINTKDITANNITVSDTTETKILQVDEDATVEGKVSAGSAEITSINASNIQITNKADIQTLDVKGDATVEGKVSAGSATIANLITDTAVSSTKAVGYDDTGKLIPINGVTDNATNITSILTGLSTVNTSDTSSIYYKLMKLIYPVGSLYWSSKSTSPATLFGGTWVQIKDRFVLACGDTYKTVGATGGASSVTLSVSNMPSHTHSFTPSGTVSSHSHGLNNHTHTFKPDGEISSHSHGLNNHTHSFTPSGSISSSGEHYHYFEFRDDSASWSTTKSSTNVNAYHSVASEYVNYNSNDIQKKAGDVIYYPSVSSTDRGIGVCFDTESNGRANPVGKYLTNGFQGSTSWSGYHKHSFSGSAGTTGGASGNTEDATPTFKGTAGTTDGNSGDTTSVQPTFSGIAGTTGSNGSGTAFSILPPYVVKYCWERTA